MDIEAAMSREARVLGISWIVRWVCVLGAIFCVFRWYGLHQESLHARRLNDLVHFREVSVASSTYAIAALLLVLVAAYCYIVVDLGALTSMLALLVARSFKESGTWKLEACDSLEEGPDATYYPIEEGGYASEVLAKEAARNYLSFLREEGQGGSPDDELLFITDPQGNRQRFTG